MAVRNPPLPAPVSSPTQQGPAQMSSGSSGVYVLSSGGRYAVAVCPKTTSLPR